MQKCLRMLFYCIVVCLVAIVCIGIGVWLGNVFNEYIGDSSLQNIIAVYQSIIIALSILITVSIITSYFNSKHAAENMVHDVVKDNIEKNIDSKLQEELKNNEQISQLIESYVAERMPQLMKSYGDESMSQKIKDIIKSDADLIEDLINISKDTLNKRVEHGEKNNK